MGCAFTKSPNDNACGGGAKKNTTNVQVQSAGQTEQPQTDPRLPLNVRQKFNISKSWKGIARAMESTGISMFVK